MERCSNSDHLIVRLCQACFREVVVSTWRTVLVLAGGVFFGVWGGESSVVAVAQGQESETPEGGDPETSQYLAELAAAGLGIYAREDPRADTFSIERAMSFMDGVAVSWGDRYECVTCHTNGFYLTVPPELGAGRPDFERAQAQARAYVESWPDLAEVRSEKAFLEDTYVVATAAFLSISELQTTGNLSDVAIESLNRAWALQDLDGHWENWIVCNWPPFESDHHFGVSLMALAVGMAPEMYRRSAPAREGMARLRRFFSANPPEHTHQRGMLLWVSRYVEDLITADQRDAWIDELRGLQRDDGGWASGALGAWRRRDGAETQPWVRVESDGYGTGFVTFVLLEAGVPVSDSAITRGLQWLRDNQRERGYWWTQSLRNNLETPNFLTHTGTTFAIKALAAARGRDPE